jgi:hypothetical protein
MEPLPNHPPAENRWYRLWPHAAGAVLLSTAYHVGFLLLRRPRPLADDLAEALTGPTTVMVLFFPFTALPFGSAVGLMWLTRAAFPRAVPRVAAVLFSYAAAAGCWVWSASIWGALGEL